MNKNLLPLLKTVSQLTNTRLKYESDKFILLFYLFKSLFTVGIDVSQS